MLWLQIALAGTLPLPERFFHFIKEADSLYCLHQIQLSLAFSVNPHLRSGSFRIIREESTDTYLIEGADTMVRPYAVWALLQEGYGLLFPHPRTVVRSDYRLKFDTLTATPRFEWRGFHLHTQHPL